MSDKIVEFLETFRNAVEQLAMQGGMSDKEVAIWAREFKDAQWTTIVEGDDSTLPEGECVCWVVYKDGSVGIEDFDGEIFLDDESDNISRWMKI